MSMVVSEKAVKLVLEYMHTGNVWLEDEECAQQALKQADCWQIQNLCNACIGLLMEYVVVGPKFFKLKVKRCSSRVLPCWLMNATIFFFLFLFSSQDWVEEDHRFANAFSLKPLQHVLRSCRNLFRNLVDLIRHCRDREDLDYLLKWRVLPDCVVDSDGKVDVPVKMAYDIWKTILARIQKLCVYLNNWPVVSMVTH